MKDRKKHEKELFMLAKKFKFRLKTIKSPTQYLRETKSNDSNNVPVHVVSCLRISGKLKP